MIQLQQQRKWRQCFQIQKPLGEDVKADKNGKQLPHLLRYGKWNRLTHILLLVFHEVRPHCLPTLNQKMISLKIKCFNVYALLTRMLSLPSNNEETVCINVSLSGREVTSQTEPLTWNPFFSHSLKLWLSSVSDMSHTWILAPKADNSSTMACLSGRSTKKISLKILTIEDDIKRKKNKPDSSRSTGYKSSHTLKTPPFIHLYLFACYLQWLEMP